MSKPKATDEEWEDVKEGEEEEEDTTINNSDVVMKYKKAGTYANEALSTVLKAAVAGAKVADLCALGDKTIVELCAKLFKGIDKGVAFPTCVNVNSCVCNYSPGHNEDDKSVLNDKDVVRVDLGVHIDGYVAVVAHTIVVGAEEVPEGKEANVIAAAASAINVAVRKLRPGCGMYDITDMIEKTAAEYGVNPVEGVLSHEVKRFIIDSARCFPCKKIAEHPMYNYEVTPASVFTVDVVLSTGKGKLKEREVKTTVYKQGLDVEYKPKLTAAREELHTINSKFQMFPFAVRALDAKKGRLAISELSKHNVCLPYPTLFERDGEAVAQFKVTVLVTNTKIERITGLTPPKTGCKVEVKDAELLEASKLPMTHTRKEKK